MSLVAVILTASENNSKRRDCAASSDSAEKQEVATPPVSPDTTSGTSACSTQTEANREGTRPLLCDDWLFQDQFDRHGGILTGPNSDVELKIPAGTISSEADDLTISAAVSTELSKAHSELKLKEKEFIASPVVEYFAGDADVLFQKPVEIVLPHFLPQKTKEASVFICQFSYCQEKGFMIERLEQNDTRTPGTYSFGSNNRIHVFVDHFSGFCAVGTCEGVCKPDDLSLELFAAHQVRSDGRRNISVRLEIRNSRLNIVKDFKKNRTESLNTKQLVPIDSKLLHAFPSENVSDVTVSLRLVFANGDDENVWEHCADGEGEIAFPVHQTLRLERFLSCKCRYFATPEVVEWHLTNSQSAAPDAFEGYINATYVTVQPNSSCPQQKFKLSIKQTDDLSSANQMPFSAGTASQVYPSGAGYSGVTETGWQQNETVRKTSS